MRRIVDDDLAGVPMRPAEMALNQLRKGDSAVVTSVADGHGDDSAALKRRLLELGFVPGETIRIVAEAFPSRDPIAVRVGGTTFALRRHEASMVRVAQAAPRSL